MNARDDEVRGLVADAVVAELAEVLNTADMDADVSTRPPGEPVFVGYGESSARAMAQLARSSEDGPTIVIELSPGNAAVLAQTLKGASDD